MLHERSVRELIERALLRELGARRGLRPHVQLAIAPDASPGAVEQAYATLRDRYDPAVYAEYGPAAVEAAGEISELLRLARELMREPASNDAAAPPELTPLGGERSDETRRALETLRGAIERRLAAAEAHREAGRPLEAVSVLQSVLLLDRRNARAHEALRALRPLVKRQQGPGALRRFFTRLFGSRSRSIEPRA